MDPKEFLGKFYQKKGIGASQNTSSDESPADGVESERNEERGRNEERAQNEEMNENSDSNQSNMSLNNDERVPENAESSQVPFNTAEKLVYHDANLDVKCLRLHFKRLKRFCLAGKF